MVYGVRLGLTVAVLSILLAKVDVGEMAKAFGRVRWSFLVGALVLVGPNLGLQCYKWGYLVRFVKPEVSIGEIVRSVLAGLTAWRPSLRAPGSFAFPPAPIQVRLPSREPE